MPGRLSRTPCAHPSGSSVFVIHIRSPLMRLHHDRPVDRSHHVLTVVTSLRSVDIG